MAKPSICFEATPALIAFRQTAGDANRLLNTLLVGVETLKSTIPICPSDLVVGWTIPTTATEWNDARNFALRMTMVAVVDGLDQFLRTLSRVPDLVPADLHDALNGRRSPGFQRRPTLPERLEILSTRYPSVARAEHLAAMQLLATWRNTFVHSDYRFGLSSPARRALLTAAPFFEAAHGGADIAASLQNFDARQPPSITDVATLIASAHRLVTALDEHILYLQDGEAYSMALMSYLISAQPNPKEFVKEVWRYGGTRSAGRVHALFLKNGGNHSTNRTASAPAVTRAQLNGIFAFGRNHAYEVFGL